MRAHREAIEATGAKVIPLEAERRSLNPITAGYAAGQLAAILEGREGRHRPLHRPAQHPRRRLRGGHGGDRRRVYALTGLGFLGARTDRIAALSPNGPCASSCAASRPARPATCSRTRTIRSCSASIPRATERHHPRRRRDRSRSPQARSPAAAAAAQGRHRRPHALVEGHRRGGRGGARSPGRKGLPSSCPSTARPIPSNPKSIPEETLKAWSRGARHRLAWQRREDVAAVWRDHHVACLPSRGGEGLPRTLLEAAACGRAIVTTDVPGCRTLVRDGLEGRLVPAGDAAAWPRRSRACPAEPELVARMGAAARARVLDGFTERDVMETVKRLYQLPCLACMIADPAAFIRAETRLRPVPHAPEIALHVADEATELWQKTEEELGEIGLPPPFWAFAWAGGQALARYILDHPETVRGRRVLDFASGSGLVAIAAMKAGARRGDRLRHRCLRHRGHRPQCRRQRRVRHAAPGGPRRRRTAAGTRCSPATSATSATSPRGSIDWLFGLSGRGATVLIGDPGRSYLPKDRLDSLAVYRCR